MFLGLNACDFSFPSSVEITGTLKLPLRVKEANLSDFISDEIKEAMEKAGEGDGDDAIEITVLPYDGIKIDGKDVQAFLIHLNILNKRKLDFIDEIKKGLEVMDKFKDSFDDLVGEHSIPLGDLANFDKFLSEMEFPLEIGDFITEFSEELEDFFSNYEPHTAPMIIARDSGEGIPFAALDKENFMSVINHEIDFNDDDNDFEIKFGTVSFSSGYIYIDVEMTISDDELPLAPFNSAPLTGDDFISFGEVRLKIGDGEHDKIAGVDIGNENTPGLLLTGAEPQTTLRFDLGGKTLNDKFIIEVDGYESNTNIITSGPARFVDITLTPRIEQLKIQGIEDFELTQNKTILIGESFPLDTDNFILARVGKGSIDLYIDIPARNTQGNTWVEFEMDATISITQEPDLPDLPGLNLLGITIDHHDDEAIHIPLVVNDEGEYINTEPVEISGTAEIEQGSKVSFWLKEGETEINLKITPDINIEKLEFVRINASDFIDLDDIFDELERIDLTEAGEYLKWIRFERIGVEIEFGDVDIDDLEIAIWIPNPNPHPLNDGPYLMHSGYQNIAAGEKVLFIHEDEITWHFQDNDGEPILNEIEFELGLKIGGQEINKTTEVIEIRNIELSGIEALRFEIGDIKPINDWSAAINLSSVDVFDEIDDFDEIDLSALAEYMFGFTFPNLDARLYINAPDLLFELLNSGLDEFGITAQSAKFSGDGIDLFHDDAKDEDGNLRPLVNSAPLILPDDRYSAPSLPANGIRLDFSGIFAEMPEDLTFNFKLPSELEIKSDFLDSGISTDDTLSISILLVLPLNMKAGDKGAKFGIPNSFDEDDDIFFRKKSDNPFDLDDIDLKKLRLSIELGDNIFQNGTLFMREKDENEISDEEGIDHVLLKFPLSGNTMNISIGENVINQIIAKNPYVIEEMGIWFESGFSLSIPPNLELIQIEFETDIRIGF
jgi:hypothetical protein